jgi:hypothetical protein
VPVSVGGVSEGVEGVSADVTGVLGGVAVSDVGGVAGVEEARVGGIEVVAEIVVVASCWFRTRADSISFNKVSSVI